MNIMILLLSACLCEDSEFKSFLASRGPIHLPSAATLAEQPICASNGDISSL